MRGLLNNLMPLIALALLPNDKEFVVPAPLVRDVADLDAMRSLRDHNRQRQYADQEDAAAKYQAERKARKLANYNKRTKSPLDTSH